MYAFTAGLFHLKTTLMEQNRPLHPSRHINIKYVSVCGNLEQMDIYLSTKYLSSFLAGKVPQFERKTR